MARSCSYSRGDGMFPVGLVMRPSHLKRRRREIGERIWFIPLHEQPRKPLTHQVNEFLGSSSEFAHQSDVRVAWPRAVASTQFEQRVAKLFGHPARFKILVADDISRQEREHCPDLVTGDVSIHRAVQSRYLPYLDVVHGPAGFRNSFCDDGPGLRYIILAQAEIKKNAIRSPSGCRQSEWMRSREKHL